MLNEAALTNHVVMFVLPEMEVWRDKFLTELIEQKLPFKCLDQRVFLSGRKVAPIAVPIPAASGEQIREIGTKIGMIQ